jgi:glutathione S-transferase
MTIRKELNDVTLPRHLSQMNAMMAQSKTNWIANTPEPSIADFMLVPRLQWLISGQHDGISVDILKPFSHLTGLMDRLLNLPAIKNYYDSKK